MDSLEPKGLVKIAVYLKATDGFSPSNLIGVGLVYKGILSQGEKIVAVKVLNLQCHGASKSFFAECEALRHIKNRNLVKVLTACSSVDYHGNDFKALVYEFMVNDEAHKYFRNLDLLQRLNIAIDVVSALDYLHNHCPEPIINCDLKPSNVLLDNEMTAQKPPLDSSANQSSSIGMGGSVGYAAPEMFMGMRPTNKKCCDGLGIHDYVKMALPEEIQSIVDPTLFQQRENGEASSSINNTQNPGSASSAKVQECLISVLKIEKYSTHFSLKPSERTKVRL
ncbi:hypothetical protein ACSBR1_017576 [Camellia fascicularis]